MEHEVAGPGPGAAAPGQRLGSLIGGGFGLIYVEVNAGALAASAAAALRIAAAVAFAALVALLAAGRGPGAVARGAARGGFGPRYWLVVAAEVAAIAAGSALLNGPLDRPRAVVAWVSVVVGVHFFARAALWRVSWYRWLGAAIALCGLAGLAAAGLGASSAVIAAVGGVLPGALLLAAGYRGAIAPLNRSGRPRARSARQPGREFNKAASSPRHRGSARTRVRPGLPRVRRSWSARCGITGGAREVDGLVWFLADHPAVVPAGDGERIACAEDELAAVGHADGGLSGDDHPDVAFLA